MLPGLYPYFDPLKYPLEVLQRFTPFSAGHGKALQIQGFFNRILQHFHPLVKFESLHLRQEKKTGRQDGGLSSFIVPAYLLILPLTFGAA